MNLPLVISLPHCSSRIPDDIMGDFALNQKEIAESEDYGIREIFASLPAKTVKADTSRLVVDLNRSPDNRGPKGVVAETDYHGRQIYKSGRYPEENTIQKRITQYYRPFHEKIEAVLGSPGIMFLFDCHSLNGTGPPDAPDAGEKRKDIILSNCGDENGRIDPESGDISCPADLITNIKSIFERFHFSVSINNPYRGGYITCHYGMKYRRQKKGAMQIELNQDLFMNTGGTGVSPEKARKIEMRMAAVFKEIAGRLLQPEP